MNRPPEVAPLTKTASVPCGRDRAFELFTREMSAWWPFATHSVGADATSRVDVQGRVGGDIVEILPDGSTAIWGTITAWEPPGRVAFSWHPGDDSAAATSVEVCFDEAGAGTRVTLVHDGWSTRPDGLAARANYDSGWDYVLDRFGGEATRGYAPANGSSRSLRT